MLILLSLKKLLYRCHPERFLRRISFKLRRSFVAKTAPQDDTRSELFQCAWGPIGFLIAFNLLLLAPFINFLKFNQYNYFRPEVLTITGALIICATLFAFVYHCSNWALRAFFFALIVTVAFSFFPEGQSLGALLLTFLITLFITILCSKEVNTILIVVVSIFTISILLLPGKKQLNEPILENTAVLANAKLPPVFYLILDEHGGLDGFPEHSPIKNLLKEFYLRWGFKVFSAAYSHYPATCNSIPNLLNFTVHDRDNYYFKKPEQRLLKQNVVFNLLSAKGYKVRVYQPDFIDYCHGDKTTISSCYTYPSLSIKTIEKLPMPFFEHLIFLTKSFLLQSSVYQWSMKIYYKLQFFLQRYGIALPQWNWYQARVSSLNMLDVFAKLRADMGGETAGTIFFAHILAPHNPFAFDSECRLMPVANWEVTRGPLPLINTPFTREKRYAAYGNQVICVQKQLQILFMAMQQVGIYNQAIIIVHGDHGSRIALHSLYPSQQSKLTQQDFKDYYDALFVSKLPGQTPGYDQQPADLQSLLANSMFAILGKQVVYVAPKVPFVYLHPTQINGQLERVLVKDFH